MRRTKPSIEPWKSTRSPALQISSRANDNGVRSWLASRCGKFTITARDRGLRAIPMPSRILVLSASVGAGHLRAAEAVELALRQTAPDAVVKNVDVLEMTNRVFRQLYGRFYLDLVNKAPHVLGYFYDMLDRPSRSGKNRGDRFRLLLQKLNLRPFLRFLQAEPWDLVINTHFLPAEIIASLRKARKLSVPQVTVTTEFETHR